MEVRPKCYKRLMDITLEDFLTYEATGEPPEVKVMMYPVDENGIPGTMGDDRFFDAGDSCAIASTIRACGGESTNLLEFLYHGYPARHPNNRLWPGKPNRFSRDQMVAMICAGIRLGVDTAVDALFKWHKEDKYFITAWNTVSNGPQGKPQWPDICGPEVWALWIRYKKPWWGYPLLLIFDIQTVIGAVQWRWFPKNQLCRNHMLVSLAMKTCPTVWAWLVNEINNWQQLIVMWAEHCYRSYEYDTSGWFAYALGGEKPIIEEQKYKTRVT